MDQRTIIIDQGSFDIRAGFGPKDLNDKSASQPSVVIPSLVGVPKPTITITQKNVAKTVNDQNYILGNQLRTEIGNYEAHSPITRGSINDWEEILMTWSYIFENELRISSNDEKILHDRKVLFAEPVLMSHKEREKIAQILFQRFGVSGLCFASQPVLSLFAASKTTGTVLDIGGGLTQVVSVVEGCTVKEATSKIELGGEDITNYLQLLLRKSGYSFSKSSELEIIRQIKESKCYVSKSPGKEEIVAKTSETNPESVVTSSYDLPDGHTIQLNSERFRSPEILFRPSILGSEYRGVHEMVFSSIQKVSIDAKKELYRNIVLSGGSTLTLGFADRIFSELKNLVPTDVKVKLYAPAQRKNSAWVGGAILSSLSTFSLLTTTREEYRENGSIIHKKASGIDPQIKR